MEYRLPIPKQIKQISEVNKQKMTNKQQENGNYLDARNIPKFQFQIMNDELVKCIKELYIQSKSQQKIVNTHKKQLQQKVSHQQFIESLQLVENGLSLSPQLSTLLTGNTSMRSKQSYSDPNNLLITCSAQLSTRLCQVTQILNILNNKLSLLDKKVQRTQQSITKQLKQKISSVEQQLTTFVKDYRGNFMQMSKKVEQTKFVCETKAKDVEMNTLWRINQCNKRLQERPTIDMVKSSITQTQQRLLSLIQPTGGVKTLGVNNSNGETARIEQDVIKLKKLIDFNNIQIQSQIKSLNDKLQNSYLTIKTFSQEKLQLVKKIENLSVANGEHARRIKSLEGKSDQEHQMGRRLEEGLNGHNQLINTLGKKLDNLTKSDDIAKMLSQIDPHEICRISTDIKSLQSRMTTAYSRITSLDTFTQALRGKMQFWNSPSSTTSSTQPPLQLFTTLIKQQLQNSQFKSKILKHQQQILDLISLKQGVNDILKKLARLGKDNDLTGLKYEIHGVQEYVKKEILILGGKVSNLENIVQGLSEIKRRPSSAKIKDDGAKIYASLSTKKLIPASCLSCHQTAPIFIDSKQRQRKIAFSNRLFK